MKQTQFFAIADLLSISLLVPTKGNVPDSLLNLGDGSGSGIATKRNSGWTMEDHYNLCVRALANNATFDDVDKYCRANCNMSFGALHNFIELLHNPVTFD